MTLTVNAVRARFAGVEGPHRLEAVPRRVLVVATASVPAAALRRSVRSHAGEDAETNGHALLLLLLLGGGALATTILAALATVGAKFGLS
jgi:hypothetical protein